MYDLVIDGRRVTTETRFPVLNPATGAVVAEAPNATEADLDRAVEVAQAAFRDLSARPEEERRGLCEAMAAKLEAHAEELAQLLTREQGKPLNGLGSRWELGAAVVWARHTCTLSLPVKTIQNDNRGTVELHRKPLGVVGSITPWNFPILIAVWHVVPAVLTGNTVVIKPSPYTPLTTLRFVELMNEVLPAGVLNSLAGDDRAVNLGALMSAHPGIRKIVFTGSSATGQKVAASAAATMKRLTLEMGGNDAGIVLPDADPRTIAEGVFWGAFINNGQTCAAIKRLYVHEDVYDEVCDELVKYARTVSVGDGTEEGTALGPMQNRMQFDKVSRLVADAKTRGRVLIGGEPGEGLFFPPTIIADLEDGVALVDEEQFGPALPIIRYRDIDDAIARANDSPWGLGGSIWSKDIQKARGLALRLETGSAWVNKHVAIQPDAPFGGVKGSGLGTEFGEEGLQEYTDIQVLSY
ncbi:MAG: aldehyde dehydrogenase family protein [Rhodobacteraceae bacterium]|jgi:acyl-CoA reductase-like NAD-dependent aldehyde dehydrogenase|uniref:aldehyde dehydrogenase family protein n=1 Tax=Albidovulum sp. TaxID=1872424 RepID=UPI001D292D5A|nr:aldehyde dehydrogenase family protein [uncultured Defluviimonas sp.]MCB2126708.1 aldehyde dehydrogenase family protein [Paracoccaceae bacterium]MCC0071219.1 aldehyde dehydrogenase family protein [Paracoccaceae bacterium]